MSDLVIVGSINLDEIYRVPQIPTRGETVLSASVRSRHPGGKGGNQAVAAASLTRVTVVGAVGDDVAGEFLRADLARAGVDGSRVVVQDCASGKAVVMIECGSGKSGTRCAGCGREPCSCTGRFPPLPHRVCRILALSLALASLVCPSCPS